jgi:Glycosidases
MPFNHSELKSLDQIDLDEIICDHGSYFPSPINWTDEVLYFLLTDRFSDNKEYGGYNDINGHTTSEPTESRTTPLFNRNNVVGTSWNTWFEAGTKWCGGNFNGLKDKLGYLKRLNITAIWISPIQKQFKDSNDYHGYGIQDFLDTDPNFGTKDEFRDFVKEAHKLGIRVILDIVLNHTCDVFAYNDDQPYYYFEGKVWPCKGWRKNLNDHGSLSFEKLDSANYPSVWPDSAIYPIQFQDPSIFSCKGQIRGWDNFPEYLEGDFNTYKDIDHGSSLKDPDSSWDLLRRIKEFNHAKSLDYLCKVYKYWIAFGDIDGFRIDTAKHVEPGALRYFSNVIHEFAQSIGKENFYLISEITGSREFAVDIVDTTGVDAALGIADVREKLEYLAKGKCSPGNPKSPEQEGYFDYFTNSLPDGLSSHQWYSEHIVVRSCDHDNVGQNHKFRFCGDAINSVDFLPIAFAINLTTSGIPCIYYGDEVAFNDSDPRTGKDNSYSDVFLRACMFGGSFGSFQSTGKHFFNENHEIYHFVSEIAGLRKNHITLRRGRQYLREISSSGTLGDFWYPQPIEGKLNWVIAWSRIFVDNEYLCAVNTDYSKILEVYVTVDNCINQHGKFFECIYSTDKSQLHLKVSVVNNNGASIVIKVPALGFVIYSNKVV